MNFRGSTIALSFAAWLLFTAVTPLPVSAQPASAWPSKPVRIVLGFPPGGSTDILARIVANRLTAVLGQSVVVENKPGANTIIATDFVAKSPPDGYNLLVGASSAMTINPLLYTKLPYRGAQDFSPITVMGSFPMVVSVNPSLAVSSIRELIALAKAKPGQLNYAAGSTAFQIATEMFKTAAGVQINHIPYKGSAQMVNAVMAGDVQLAFIDSGAVMSQVRSGKVRGIAVTSAKRSPLTGDLPTLAEAGVPGYEVTLWVALFAPAGTPAEIIARVQAEVAKMMQEAGVRDQLIGIGIEPGGMPPAELAAMIRAEAVRYADVVRSVGIKAE